MSKLRCRKCREPKHKSDMLWRVMAKGNEVPSSLCLECSVATVNEWHRRHRPGRRWRHLRRRYGVTRTQYLTLLKKQKGLCAICRKPPDPKSKKNRILVVDHNHKTGKVRALLCFRCNLYVGWVECGDLMVKILAYLKKHSQLEKEKHGKITID